MYTAIGDDKYKYTLNDILQKINALGDEIDANEEENRIWEHEMIDSGEFDE
jgi:hypothetical protein